MTAVLEGHDAPVTAVALGLMRDREVVVSGDEAGAVRWWDAATGELIDQAWEDADGPIQGLAIVDAGDTTVVAAVDGNDLLVAWDADITIDIREIHCPYTVDFGPYILPIRGRPAIVVATTWMVMAVDAVTGRYEELGDVRARIGDPPGYYNEKDGHDGGMSRFFAGLLDGQPAWVTSDTSYQYVWSGGFVRCTLTGGPGLQGTAMALGTLDGRPVVANNDAAHGVWLHDGDTGAALAGPLTGCTGGIVGVGLAPDAVVAASLDGTVRRWPVGGPSPEPAVAVLPGPPAAMVVSPRTGRAWSGVGNAVVATA
jgi:WD40 repeat protein